MARILFAAIIAIRHPSTARWRLDGALLKPSSNGSPKDKSAARHEKTISGNNRMSVQLRNLSRKKPEELEKIRDHARMVRESLASEALGTH